MKLRELKIHNFRCVHDATVLVSDYGLLIGANNSGKSSVIDAIRVVYEDLKFDPAHDTPKRYVDPKDTETWVELEFELTPDEATRIKNEYLMNGNRFRVRRNLQGTDKKLLHFYAYEGGKLSPNQFYGDDNVGRGKLGSVIHIPAVSKVEDVTKFSGASPLRDLINSIFKKLLKTSPAFAGLQKALGIFGTAVAAEKTADGHSLSGVEAAINDGLQAWNAKFKFRTNPLNETEVVKSLFDFSIVDGATGHEQPATSFGHGLQRHLIFTLLMVAATFNTGSKPGDKKEFSPDLTLLLFEEPEAFLHPQQQAALDASLRSLGKQVDFQVIVSTHSAYFVSRNAADLTSLCRLHKPDQAAQVGQISAADLDALVLSNQQINGIAAKYPGYKPGPEEMSTDMECVKYFMWLNAERTGLFFARRVLIVEGATEIATVNFLAQSGKLRVAPDYYVLDAMGKFNIHRFMNLLGALKIEHSVLHDEDTKAKTGDDLAFHGEVNALIAATRNAHTREVHVFPEDIERFLSFPIPDKDYRKPTRLLLALQQGKVDPGRLGDLAKIVDHLLLS
jgi:putative ATP-dependent endonuclease of the OLD family